MKGNLDFENNQNDGSYNSLLESLYSCEIRSSEVEDIDELEEGEIVNSSSDEENYFLTNEQDNEEYKISYPAYYNSIDETKDLNLSKSQKRKFISLRENGISKKHEKINSELSNVIDYIAENYCIGNIKKNYSKTTDDISSMRYPEIDYECHNGNLESDDNRRKHRKKTYYIPKISSSESLQNGNSRYIDSDSEDSVMLIRNDEKEINVSRKVNILNDTFEYYQPIEMINNFDRKGKIKYPKSCLKKKYLPVNVSDLNDVKEYICRNSYFSHSTECIEILPVLCKKCLKRKRKKEEKREKIILDYLGK